MKKCVVISCFDYYTTRTKQVLELFRNKGYETTYIISDYNHFSKQYYKVEYPGCIQISVPAYEKNLSPARLYSHHVFSSAVYQRLLQIHPDVIYCMFPPNSLVRDVAKYKSTYGGYLIFDCYDMWPESFPYQKYGKLLSIPFRKWGDLREKYIDKADLLICVSKASEEHWNNTHPDIKTAFIQPSIEEGDIPEYKPLQKDSKSFCYLGMINHITDIDLGVRLLTQLRKHCQVTLHLIGEGQNKDVFVSKLEQGGVTVIQHGVLFDLEKKNEIIAQCDFGISIPRKEIASAMPLKAVEYMRAGLPFLNAGIQDICDIVEHERVGLNIDSQDIETVISRILSLENSDIMSMRDNCLRFYRNQFVANDIASLFDEL